MTEKSGSMLGWIWVTALVLILDQGSKAWVQVVLEPGEEVAVLPVFSWMLVYNEGAAFSFLSNAGTWKQWFFMGVGIAVSLFLIRELWRLQPGKTAWAIAYSLILGGGLGNFWDRAVQSQVTDFILVHYQHHYFPVFNLADCAISLGAACWIVLAFLEWRQQGTQDA